MGFAAALVFAAGLLLAVRVMFFGVRRAVGDDFVYRASRLAAAAALGVGGALWYAVTRFSTVTLGSVALVVGLSLASAAGAWWLVRKSASVGSTDPEDDPRYMYQGFVGRVVRPISDETSGKIVLQLEGKSMELGAQWSPASGSRFGTAEVGAEVVIELVDGDVAYVEPWALVEGRL